MVDFFKTGKGVDLEVLTSATLSKLEEIKEKTAAGQVIGEAGPFTLRMNHSGWI